MKFGDISASLDRWRSATTCVPEGKHYNLLAADAVLKLVVNSRQMDTPLVLAVSPQLLPICTAVNWQVLSQDQAPMATGMATRWIVRRVPLRQLAAL